LPLVAVWPAACGGPDAVESPTWADVEPILRAQCNHCHGASARTNAAVGSLVYRFDFFEMTDAVCGEAALALGPGGMARDWASAIKSSITPPATGGRPRMPPAPASALPDWQRETLLRWAQSPRKGLPPIDNHRPSIEVLAPKLPTAADPTLAFTVVVRDADGEPVVGVLKVGSHVLRMDRSGSFSAELDTRTWPAGPYPVTAVLCDGWGSFSYDLGTMHLGPR
jgi:hypothetical protein